MPYKEWRRERSYLMPRSLDEVIAQDHPVRLVAELLETLPAETQAELGFNEPANELGRAAYPPEVLAGVWVYGFMRGIRSSRRLEEACQEQLAFRWLCGELQPDHNTLWRHWQRRRQALRVLVKRTVRVAFAAGLVDMNLEAVDGTKVRGNASKRRTVDREELARLEERTEQAIVELEAQGATGGDTVPRLRGELAKLERRRQWLREQMEALEASEGRQRNLTDPDAQLMKAGTGEFIAGYNAQATALAGPKREDGTRDLFIGDAEVVTTPADQGQLAGMVEGTERNLGVRCETVVADGGYHSGENLAWCAERGQAVVLAEGDRRRREEPFHKDQFPYDEGTDSYGCPRGERLTFRGVKNRKGGAEHRIYRAGVVCRTCPFFGTCTRDRKGRTLEIAPHERLLREHRALLETETAKAVYRRRMGMVEPVFGIVKEQMGGRRFHLRGLQGVRAEWSLLAAAFNLRMLWKTWRGLDSVGRQALVRAA